MALEFHQLVVDLDFSDGSVARADKQVTVLEELHAVDTLREKDALWANSLEKSGRLEGDLNDIASEGAHVSTRVIRGDDNTLVDSLDLAHVEVLEDELLSHVVDLPDSDSVVVDSDKALTCVVEEGDLVGDVHANSVATDGLARLSLI